MRVGVMVGYRGGRDLDKKFADIVEKGIYSCQLCCWPLVDDLEAEAAYVREKCEEYGVTISSLWCGWPGPAFWNFREGPLTLGIVPPAYRFQRCLHLQRGIEFAHYLGVKNIITHAGFIPEDMNDPNYTGTVAALKGLVKWLKQYEIRFLFETGQETPTTLVRVIEECGPEYFGVNFDAGNLILYGKANPADAIEILGKYVYDLHAKDGLYPTDGINLGTEVALGDGKANFPHIIKTLKALGYDGAVTIEREISGEQQNADILKAKAILEDLIANA